MSKAVVFRSYGDPEVLEVIDVPDVEPSAGQVRVRVRAAGLQPFDCLFRSGAAHQWMPAHFPQQLGNEFGGVVDAVGNAVTGFKIGDAVLGWGMLMSYAEHVVVNETQIVAKPEEMPWLEAGGLPASGQTASTAIDALDIGPRDVLFVHAAAGGVGSFAVQIAKARGAKVIGTASQRNHDYLISLGVTPVTYGDGLADRARALHQRGITAALIAINTEEALESSGSLGRITRADRCRGVSTDGRKIWNQAAWTRTVGHQIETVDRPLSRRKITSERRAAFPLSSAAAAHRQMEAGHVRGKLVLAI